MSTSNEEYKNKLRKHSAKNSDPATGEDLTADSDLTEENLKKPVFTTVSTEQDNSEIIEETENKDKEGENSKQVVEIPVISMEDFKQVQTDNKLNLLMVAINKINTNFHYKFDAIRKEMSDDKIGINPRIKLLEQHQDEMLARIDDMESEKPKIEDLITRVADLEKQNARLSDDIEVLKGIVQVQEKQIKSSDAKITDLTVHSMGNNVIITGILKINQKKTAN